MRISKQHCIPKTTIEISLSGIKNILLITIGDLTIPKFMELIIEYSQTKKKNHCHNLSKKIILSLVLYFRILTL